MRRVSVIMAVIATVGLVAAQAQASPPAPPSSISVFAPPGQNGDALRIVLGASPDDGGGNNDVTRYVVERLQLPGTVWQSLPKVTATDAASYTINDVGLARNTRYRYRIAATNGEWSSWVVGAATTEDRKQPGPPGLDAADRPDDQGGVITLTITRSADDGAGANDVKRYEIRRRVPGGKFAFLRNVAATGAAQYVVSDAVDLKASRYDYKVRAFDGLYYSAAAMDSATGRDNTKPRPPRNLTVTDVPGDQGKQLLVKFAASLDDGHGAKDVRRYRIQRKPLGGSFAPVTTLRANGSSTYQYIDSGLQAGQTYTYRVVAFDGRNTSDPVFATGKTVDNRTPRPPSGLTVADRPNDNGDALILNWSASGDDGARANDVVEYHLFRNPGPEGALAVGLVAKVPATGAASYTYTDTGLTPRQKYNYSVRAFDGSNLSSAIYGSGTPTDDNVPRPPKSVTVTDVPGDNGGAAKVSFTGSRDDGTGADDVASYEVMRKRSGGAYEPVRTVSATNSQLYEFTDTGLVSNVQYTYRVRAYDGTQYSDPAFGAGKALDNTPPAPPTDFTVVARPNAAGAADITFTASVDDTTAHPEVSKYEIYRKRSGEAWPTTPTLTVTATRAAAYAASDSGLTVGAAYAYRARSKAATGFSEWTAWQTITAVDTRKPAPPRNLTAADRPDDTGEAVTVAWARSADDGAGANLVARYVVYRKLTSVLETPTTQVGTVTATGAATYQLLDTTSSLMNLRSYTYWATAATATGTESDPSNTAEAVPRNDTILAAPTNLTAADQTGTSNAITLSWKRSSSEGGGVTPPPPPFSVGTADSASAVEGDYEVFRRRSTQDWSTAPYMVVPATTSGDPLTVVDSGATNGITYQYRVRYRIDTSISPFSNTASAAAKSDSASTADAASGLSVTIAEAPATAAVGAPIAVRVTVAGEGLSTVGLQWRVNEAAWHRTAVKTARDSYEATFSLAPGSVAPGDVIGLVAVATDAAGTAASDEVRVTVTR